MDKSKAAFGHSGGYSYAVKLTTLEQNNFFDKPFGRRLKVVQAVKEFEKTARVTYIDTKHKSTMGAVRKWIRTFKPAEFFAQWSKANDLYNDGCVKIYYTN